MIHQIVISGEYDNYLDYLVGLYRPRMDALNKSLTRYLGDIEVPLTFPSVQPGDIEKGIEGIAAAYREKR